MAENKGPENKEIQEKKEPVNVTSDKDEKEEELER